MTAALTIRLAPRIASAAIRRFDRPGQVVAALVAAGVGYRLYLILAGVPGTNSDEATMGLAALHIANGSHYPAFFYGQHYMGTLEAYLAAPLFAAFEPSSVMLRLPLLPTYAAFCYLMYWLTRRLYDRWFAVFVVGLLALGSNAVVHGQISAGGGYPEMKPIGAGALLLAVWLGGGYGSARRRLLGFAGWGLLAGLAVWIDWLILPYVAAAGVVLLYGCRRQLLGRPGALLVVGLLVGAAPSISHHLRPGVLAQSMTTFLHLSGAGQVPLWDRVYGGLLFGVPLGTGLCGPGRCEGWPLALGAGYPLLLLLAAALAVAALRTTTSPLASDARRGSDRVRQAGRLALVAAAAMVIVGYVRSDQAGLSPSTSVRYVTPVLITLPAVLWPLWAAATRLLRSRPPYRVGTLISGVAGAVLVAVLAGSMVPPTIAAIRDAPHGKVVARQERALIAELDRQGVTRIYTDYWTCNRLAFATDERVVCGVLDENLQPGHDRYLPYREILRNTPNPAYVLPIGSPQDLALAARLTTQGIQAGTVEVAGYRVYRPHLPPLT